MFGVPCDFLREDGSPCTSLLKKEFEELIRTFGAKGDSADVQQVCIRVTFSGHDAQRPKVYASKFDRHLLGSCLRCWRL